MARMMTETEFGKWADENIGKGLTDFEKGMYYEIFLFGMRWARA